MPHPCSIGRASRASLTSSFAPLQTIPGSRLVSASNQPLSTIETPHNYGGKIAIRFNWTAACASTRFSSGKLPPAPPCSPCSSAQLMLWCAGTQTTAHCSLLLLINTFACDACRRAAHGACPASLTRGNAAGARICAASAIFRLPSTAAAHPAPTCSASLVPRAWHAASCEGWERRWWGWQAPPPGVDALPAARLQRPLAFEFSWRLAPYHTLNCPSLMQPSALT